MEKEKKLRYEELVDEVARAEAELYHRRKAVEKVIEDEVEQRGGPFAFEMDEEQATKPMKNDLARLSNAAAIDSFAITLWDKDELSAENGFILGVWKEGDPEEIHVKGLYAIQNKDYDRQFNVPLNHVENIEEVLNFIIKFG